jgi:hypothetical protein
LAPPGILDLLAARLAAFLKDPPPAPLLERRAFPADRRDLVKRVSVLTWYRLDRLRDCRFHSPVIPRGEILQTSAKLPEP